MLYLLLLLSGSRFRGGEQGDRKEGRARRDRVGSRLPVKRFPFFGSGGGCEMGKFLNATRRVQAPKEKSKTRSAGRRGCWPGWDRWDGTRCMYMYLRTAARRRGGILARPVVSCGTLNSQRGEAMHGVNANRITFAILVLEGKVCTEQDVLP